ncbi:MAG: hypothetical protein J6L69_06910 [Lachnospiraceae bacterium]|nr:hypothetical protein [Lachnospiraceae bacterium]
MADEKEVTLANTHVPDKLYGYGLQVRQMLYELLNCGIDSVVSVEKFDDVGVENGDEKTAIQTKSALSDRNPVSDRAVDLWKTLYNWLIALKENELPLNSALFTLVINTNKSGNIVTWINQVRDEKEAEEVYEKIKGEFTGEDGKYTEQSDAINNYVITFLSEENKKYALYIIEKFKLVVMDEGHTKKIYDEFRAKSYLPPDIQQLVFDRMLGWIDKTTALQIENGQVMQIAKTRFNNELTLTQKLVNQNKCLVELAPNPTNNEIELQQNEYKTYLRQLQIIDLDYDDQLIAINDYLKASANRTIWAVNGDINEDVLRQYYEDLQKRWKTKKNIIEMDKAGWEDSMRGRYLYNICQDEDVNNSIIMTPRSFKNGCYHELADQQQIGWHPDYKQKLKEDEKNV